MAHMNNGGRSLIAIAGLGAAAMVLPAPGTNAAETRKPNVIIILADDQGFADVGVQGCKDVKTPNIDSIARNGVRFTNGYVSCPVCSPTRAGLLTGRYQQRFGHEHNPGPASNTRVWGLPLSQKTIAQYMKEQGYATGIVGKWHQGDTEPYHPNQRGFDDFYGFIGGAHGYLRPGVGFNRIQRNGVRVAEKEYLTDAFGREAVAFIDKNKEKPFFLYLAFNAVHQPLDVPAKDRDSFSEIKDPKRQRFAYMLKSLDTNVGRVLTRVRDAGLEKDTLIVYLSDNGGPTMGNTSRNDPFRGYKGDVYEGGIHIPFMAQWKGKIPAGKVEERPVISLDLLPTAVAAAGGKVAENVDGVDLMPYLTGDKSGSPHEALYWRYSGQSAIRMGEWKLVHPKGGTTALYRLSDDPGEKTDLMAKQPEKAKELQAAWDRWNTKNIPALWPSVPPAARRPAAGAAAP